MDVGYINPFISAVRNLFDTMIQLPVTLGKPELKRGQATSNDISGIIGISGDVSGSVVVGFPGAIAKRLASVLLGEEVNEIDDYCTDVIGEIANMVAGDAKNGFPKSNTTVSVPTVVIGKHEVTFPRGVPIITIPCATGSGTFTIDVALKT
ncbi:MAG: chemotaxis protein CheX [Desulfobacteraceae bacterium]|nr:chemotaxis protein CheX [Desulfobacteraceae bacterium]